MRRRRADILAARLLAALIAAMVAVTCVALRPQTAEAAGRRVVVSLGDSYSSGEGNPPFYGAQFAGADDSVTERFTEGSAEWLALEDYKAHRSELSWPGLVELDGVRLRDSRYRDVGSGARWYFYASSGAVAYNVYGDGEVDGAGRKVNPSWGRQEKSGLSGGVRVQLDAAREEVARDGGLDDVVYVTMTIGGNDMNFAGIVTEVAIRNGFVDRDYLLNTINRAWYDYDESFRYVTFETPFLAFRHQGGAELKRDLISTCYDRVCDAFGEGTEVIVAGYPTLMNDDKWLAFLNSSGPLDVLWRFLDWGGSNVVGFADWEAWVINENVHLFNERLQSLTEECSARHGGRLHFVPVEGLFIGHEAYTDDPCINGIKFEDPGAPGEFDISYSFHPNGRGIACYHAAVQEEIDRLEEARPPAVDDGEAEEATAHYTYLDVIDSYRSAYGWRDTREVEGLTCVAGLCFADLLDFDGDGTEELALAWCDPSDLEAADGYSALFSGAYHVEVWGYDGGSAVLLRDLGDEVLNSSEVGGYLAVGTWPGGAYLVGVPHGGRLVAGRDYVTSYWGLRGGEFRVLLSDVMRAAEKGFDNEYYVDGTQVEEWEYLSARADGSADYQQKSYDLITYGGEEYLGDTFRVTEETIARLEALG